MASRCKDCDNNSRPWTISLNSCSIRQTGLRRRIKRPQASRVTCSMGQRGARWRSGDLNPHLSLRWAGVPAGAEAPVERAICVVAEWKRTGPAAGSAPGTVTVGGGQPGDRSRAGVAESELRRVSWHRALAVVSGSRPWRRWGVNLEMGSDHCALCARQRALHLPPALRLNGGLASAAAGSCLHLLGVDYHDLRAPGLEFKRERSFAAGKCGAGPRRDFPAGSVPLLRLLRRAAVGDGRL